ncbi:hypothetical protein METBISCDRAFT_21604 [Metschnikowia bicuspidata]|uniref:Dihydrofolate reductase n=1 Tax=Metschnikowia bicuspidata TaxID=27322 RepID=A0A4P9ZGV7_9ASCO|nr:hypothetical protein METBISCDRAFT_21604 [Metschnikowia bicuspidata]
MKTKPPIAMVVAAMTPKFGIGANGKLPWRLKQETKYFKDITSHASEDSINAVIMGRKTWESIPAKFRPLPNRLNIVISRSHVNDSKDGVLLYNSMDLILTALQEADYQIDQKNIGKIFIIGGAQIYNSFVEDTRVDSLLLTNVSYRGDTKEIPAMDCFLNWDLNAWKRLKTSRLKEYVGVDFTEGIVQENDYEYEYTLWERKRDKSWHIQLEKNIRH